MIDSSQPSAARLTNVSVHYGDTVAVTDASLELRSGEVQALLGASGVGKTTLLRAIAGFERVTSGSVSVGGREVDGGAWVPPEKRRVGVVFQDYALFPHLSVARNVAFGTADRDPDAPRIRELLEMVGLPRLADRSPRELSGGEQQRVAVARALAQEPAVLLLDEPFAHLDPGRRDEVRDATLRIVREAGVAALLVTHDAGDAMVASDVIHVMSEGRIAQSGPPRDVYRHPVSRVVASALGPANFLDARRVEDATVTCALGSVDCPNAADGLLMVRPEWIVADDGGTEAVVEHARFCGSRDEVTARIGEQTVTFWSAAPVGVGTSIRIRATTGWGVLDRAVKNENGLVFRNL